MCVAHRSSPKRSLEYFLLQDLPIDRYILRSTTVWSRTPGGDGIQEFSTIKDSSYSGYRPKKIPISPWQTALTAHVYQS
jgi:hypothetical protein